MVHAKDAHVGPAPGAALLTVLLPTFFLAVAAREFSTADHEHLRRETVQMALLDGSDMLYVARHESDQPFLISSAVGKRLAKLILPHVVLVAFGTLLRQKSRDADFVGRYGGKEFVVLLPGIDLAGAREIAERMRAAWEQVEIEPIGEPLHASFGVAQQGSGESAEALLRRAEEALRTAKSSGRNQVLAAQPAVMAGCA